MEDSEFFKRCRGIGLRACVEYLTQCIEHRHKITRRSDEPNNPLEFLSALDDLENRIRGFQYDPNVENEIKQIQRRIEWNKKDLETRYSDFERFLRGFSKRREFKWHDPELLREIAGERFRDERSRCLRTIEEELPRELVKRGKQLQIAHEKSKRNLLERCGELRMRGESWRNEGNIRSVPWLILPQGTRESVLREASKEGGMLEKNKVIEERFDLMFSLNPTDVYKGINEFSGYFAFRFSECPWVIFESVVLGNAIYAIKGNWIEMSKKTKGFLMRMESGCVVRIIHSGDWFRRLRYLIISCHTTREKPEPQIVENK